MKGYINIINKYAIGFNKFITATYNTCSTHVCKKSCNHVELQISKSPILKTARSLLLGIHGTVKTLDLKIRQNLLLLSVFKY